MKEIIAAIDLGTNSARLLIGIRDGEETIEPVLLKRHITRLGGGFRKDIGISAAAGERTIEAIHDFSRHMKSHAVARYRAVATSAVRDAANGGKFVEDVFKRTGIELEIIDGKEEALLTLRGLISGLDERRGCFFVFDTGGGSTEYTLVQEETPHFTMSLPLGVVRLTEGKGNCSAMDEKITRELAKLSGEVEKAGLSDMLGRAALVGTAGTATTLASIHLKMKEYNYRRVNNYCLTINDIKAIYDKLLPMTPDQRLNIPGLEKGREDLIIAGTLITVRTMEIFGFRRIRISDFGLLEGVMLSV